MPIKFACPKCKKVLQVSSKLAGKSVKCQCGNPIKVPVPKSAASQSSESKSSASKSPSAGAAKKSKTAAGAGTGLGGAMADPGMFDQLTDGDFQRQVPFEKSGNSGPAEDETLSRFTHEEAEQKKKEAGSAKGFLVLTAILNILHGIAAIVFIAFFAMESPQLAEIGKYYPTARLGAGIGIGLFATLAALYVAGAVGLFLKSSWGWIITGALCDYFIIEWLGALGVLIKEGFESVKFYIVLGGILGGLFYAMGFFRSAVQEVCGIKSKVPVIIATIVGFLIGIGAVVAVFQTFSTS